MQDKFCADPSLYDVRSMFPAGPLPIFSPSETHALNACPVDSVTHGFLVLIRETLRPDSPIADVATIIEFAADWFNEQGPDLVIRNTIVRRLGIDLATFRLYLKAPKSVSRLEGVRRDLFAGSHARDPSPDRLWPHIVEVSRVLHKCPSVSHQDLLRSVGADTCAWWLRRGIGVLKSHGLVECKEIEIPKPRRGGRRVALWYRSLLDVGTDTSGL